MVSPLHVQLHTGLCVNRLAELDVLLRRRVFLLNPYRVYDAVDYFEALLLSYGMAFSRASLAKAQIASDRY